MRMTKHSLKRQAGYLLVEATLALSVAAGLLTLYIKEQQNALVESMAKAHGEQMRLISQALDRYIIENHTQLVAGPATGCCTLDPDGPLGPIAAVVIPVANKFAPTPAELVALRLLPAGADSPPVFGGAYNIQLGTFSSTPPFAACVAPAVDCNLVRGLLTTNQAVLRDGIVSAQVIGKALEAIGVNGGVVGLPGTPAGQVTGMNGAWNLPVPAGTPVGTMAAQVGWQWDPINNRYLRRDGSLPMTGNLNMGTLDINNASVINATTRVTTPMTRFSNTLPPGACNSGDIATSGGVLHQCIGGAWVSMNTTIDNRATIVANTVANAVFTSRMAGVTIVTDAITSIGGSGSDATCGGPNEVVDRITSDHKHRCKTLKLNY